MPSSATRWKAFFYKKQHKRNEVSGIKHINTKTPKTYFFTCYDAKNYFPIF
jgi:hypothetical protein